MSRNLAADVARVLAALHESKAWFRHGVSDERLCELTGLTLQRVIAARRDAAAHGFIERQGIDVKALVGLTMGYSGAEIEQAVISALFDSFEKNAPLSTEMISRAVRETVPLSTTMKEEIDALRDWASGRARKASLEEKEISAAPGERKFEL